MNRRVRVLIDVRVNTLESGIEELEHQVEIQKARVIDAYEELQDLYVQQEIAEAEDDEPAEPEAE